MLFLRAKRRGNEFTKESFAALTKAQMARKIGERWGEQRWERGVQARLARRIIDVNASCRAFWPAT